MANNKRNISIIYKLVLGGLILIGILGRAGIFSGDLTKLHTLNSFTSISNAYIMVLAIITAIKLASPTSEISTTLSKARYIGVVLILITGIVYHFILLPQKFADNPAYPVMAYGNIIAHYIAPIGMVVDWLLFDEKGKITKMQPLICTIVPAIYFIVMSIYGYYGAKLAGKEPSYVYFFMDWGVLGVLGVLKWVFLILLAILCLTFSIYFIDASLAKRK